MQTNKPAQFREQWKFDVEVSMCNISTFCTCKDSSCPFHPTNHDKGCAPYIHEGELIDLMARRRSIRKYTEDDIPEEKLKRILQAALLAPTSRGKRPWFFYVIKDRSVLERLSKAKWHGANLLAGCNTAIAVFADSDLSDAWIEDSSIALAYMDLMAADQGVGSCWCDLLRSTT